MNNLAVSFGSNSVDLSFLVTLVLCVWHHEKAEKFQVILGNVIDMFEVFFFADYYMIQ